MTVTGVRPIAEPIAEDNKKSHLMQTAHPSQQIEGKKLGRKSVAINNVLLEQA